jgi:hypothetical protein
MKKLTKREIEEIRKKSDEVDRKAFLVIKKYPKILLKNFKIK